MWKPLVGECLQSVSEVDKNAVAMVRTNSHSKEGVVGHAQQKSPRLYSCFFLSLLLAFWTSLQLGNSSTIEVNMDWKSLRIFIFIYLKRPLNWLKNKITKIEENVYETEIIF